MELLIIIGTIALLALALGIIFFVVLYQRRVIAHQEELKKVNGQKELELIQASILSQEEERNLIAAELHDDVVATLASARLFLYKTKDTAFDETMINKAKDLLDESMGKLRNISHKLQPAMLQHVGLEASLQLLIETINDSGAVAGQYIAKSKLPRIADQTELAVYRVSQELLTNILKHSMAKTVILETEVGETALTVTLIHDGTGMSHERFEEQIFKKGSTGLKNIVNRLKVINATIQFQQRDDQWFNTAITIPYSQ